MTCYRRSGISDQNFSRTTGTPCTARNAPGSTPTPPQMPPQAATLGPVSKRPGREQNWYPVSQVSWFTGHIREGIAVTGRQLELLQPAPARPSARDAATVARIIRVHHDQPADLTLFQNQASRWKAEPGLTTAQRDPVAGVKAAIGHLPHLTS